MILYIELCHVSSECQCQVDSKVWYVERVKKGINMQYQLLNVVKIADVCKVYSVVNTSGLAGILYLKYSQYIVRDMCCLLILSWPIHISEINSISSHIIIISYLLTLQLQLQKSPEIFKYPAMCWFTRASHHNMSSEWVWWVGGEVSLCRAQDNCSAADEDNGGRPDNGQLGTQMGAALNCPNRLHNRFKTSILSLRLGWVMSSKADFERMIFFWELWKLSLSPLCLFWDKLWDCLPECLS